MRQLWNHVNVFWLAWMFVLFLKRRICGTTEFLHNKAADIADYLLQTIHMCLQKRRAFSYRWVTNLSNSRRKLSYPWNHADKYVGCFHVWIPKTKTRNWTTTTTTITTAAAVAEYNQNMDHLQSTMDKKMPNSFFSVSMF